MSLRIVIFFLCVAFVDAARAQTCPTPYFVDPYHTAFYLDIPAPNGLPPNGPYNFYQINVWNGGGADRAGGFLFASPGISLPDGDYSSTGNGQPILFDRDSVQQAYLVDVSYNSLTSKFERRPVYVVNRFRRATGEDRLVVGRFGATDPNDNFLLTMPLVYDSQGAFDLSQPTTCQRTSTVQSFNARYLNVGVRKPAITVVQFGEYFGAEFHNSLYPNKLCTSPICPRIIPCPDC